MCDAQTRAWHAAWYAPGSLTLDFDATLLPCHSEKEQAAPNYKSGFGFHPLGCWLDESREPLAMIGRKGNAGSNTATDHSDVLFRSLEQLPVRFQIGHQPGDCADTVTHPILVRCDGAGSTKAFLTDLVERNIGFSVGFSVDQTIRNLIVALPEAGWIPAINQDHLPGRGGGRTDPGSQPRKWVAGRVTVDLPQGRSSSQGASVDLRSDPRATPHLVSHRQQRPRHRRSRTASPGPRPC